MRNMKVPVFPDCHRFAVITDDRHRLRGVRYQFAALGHPTETLAHKPHDVWTERGRLVDM